MKSLLSVVMPFRRVAAMLGVCLLLALPAAAGQLGAVPMNSSPRARLGPADQVTVTMAAGYLQIVGTDDNVVRYQAVKGRLKGFWLFPEKYTYMERSLSAVPPFDPGAIVRPGTLGLTEEWGPEGLQLTSTDPDGANMITMRVEVPRTLKQIRVTMAEHGSVGYVSVFNFDGVISAKNGNGGMYLYHPGGPVLAEASGGDIEVIVTKLPPAGGAGLDILANNGLVLITLPWSANATILLEARRGIPHSDFQGSWAYRNNDELNKPRLERDTRMNVTAGTGGVNVHVVSLNGPIIVTRAPKIGPS